jgi:hypothetical protein
MTVEFQDAVQGLHEGDQVYLLGLPIGTVGNPSVLGNRAIVPVVRGGLCEEVTCCLDRWSTLQVIENKPLVSANAHAPKAGISSNAMMTNDCAAGEPAHV